jgi:4-amino-4-deoxy-L-arabinose transferase-like glycosyltransferase
MTVRRWLILLVAVAFALRLGFFLADPNPGQNSGLAAEQGGVAHNIVSFGRWFVTDRNPNQPKVVEPHHLVDPSDVPLDPHPRFAPDVIEMPGLALVEAAAWKITGDQDYGYVQVLQVLLDSLMVPLVFWIGVRLFRRPRAALIAAGLYAVFPPLAALTKIPHLDTWSVFFTVGITALFLRALDAWDGARRWRRLIALGVVTGIGMYFRPGIVLLPLALALASLPSGGWRRSLALGGVPLVLALVFIAPWTVRNAEEFHAFIPTRLAGGQSLWEGLGEVHNDYGAVLDDVATERQVHRVRPDLVYGTPAYDNYLGNKAKTVIREHPLFYLRVLARRVVVSTVLLRNSNWAETLESPFDYTRRTGRSALGYVTHRPLDALWALLIGFLEPFLFIVGVVTAALTWRRYHREHLLLAAVVVATLAPYILLHFEPRYALPASFVYLLLFGLAADLSLDRVAARRRSLVAATA